MSFKYQINRSGAKVAADFERLLKTGDVEKITPGLYHALTQHGGFIAHYDIHGFREYYGPGRPHGLTELLIGEFYPLTDPDRWAPEQMRHLENSGYTDGLSAGDVMRMIVRIGARYEAGVKLRETEARKLAEVAGLQARYGVTHDVAQALVYSKRVEVVE